MKNTYRISFILTALVGALLILSGASLGVEFYQEFTTCTEVYYGPGSVSQEMLKPMDVLSCSLKTPLG